MNIKTLQDGVGLSGFNCTFKIEKVMDRFTGTGEYGEWSIQNLVVTDDSGKINMVLKNQKELARSAEGGFIKVECRPNKSGAMVGTKVVKETYEANDGEMKESIKLAVTANAVVTLSADLPLTQEVKPQQTADSSPKPMDLEVFFKHAGALLVSAPMQETLQAVKQAGWSSEDLRALAITLIINNNRR